MIASHGKRHSQQTSSVFPLVDADRAALMTSQLSGYPQGSFGRHFEHRRPPQPPSLNQTGRQRSTSSPPRLQPRGADRVKTRSVVDAASGLRQLGGRSRREQFGYTLRREASSVGAPQTGVKSTWGFSTCPPKDHTHPGGQPSEVSVRAVGTARGTRFRFPSFANLTSGPHSDNAVYQMG